MKRVLIESRPNDEIYTPAEALFPLLPFLPKKWILWEAARGTGILADHLLRAGFRLVAEPNDFLTWQPDEWDMIVTNPPYSTALRYSFFVRAYSLGKPFAFLLPITTLEGYKRQRLFDQYGIELILFDERINFTNGSGAWFPVAWFTHGLNLPKPLTFVSMESCRTKYAHLFFGNGNHPVATIKPSA